MSIDFSVQNVIVVWIVAAVLASAASLHSIKSANSWFSRIIATSAVFGCTLSIILAAFWLAPLVKKYALLSQELSEIRRQLAEERLRKNSDITKSKPVLDYPNNLIIEKAAPENSPCNSDDIMLAYTNTLGLLNERQIVSPSFVSMSCAEQTEKLIQKLLRFRNLSSATSVSDKTKPTLKTRMQNFVSTNRYILRPLMTGEYIEGLNGSYYLVEFKNNISSQVIEFDSGKDTLNSSLIQALIKSAEFFNQDIIDKIPDNTKFQVFLRGVADKRGWSGSGSDLNYEKILVRKGSIETGYAAKVEPHIVKKPPTNEDLPNLRAAYVRSELAKSSALGEFSILDGRFCSRGTDLILFVDW